VTLIPLELLSISRHSARDFGLLSSSSALFTEPIISLLFVCLQLRVVVGCRVVSWYCSGGSTLLEDFDWLMHFSQTFFAHPNSAKTAEVFVEHWVMLSILRNCFRFRGNFSIIRTDKTKKRKRKNFRCHFRRTIRTGLRACLF
jgi:hypothetical protein